MANPNSTFDEILTTTLHKYSDTLADNITNHNALLFRLKKKGNTKLVDGGASLTEALMYAENATVKWYAGYEELDVSASDTMTTAQFNWKQCNANVTASGEEILKNSGSRNQIFDLVKSRIMVAEKTLENTVGAAIFNSNTENDGKAIGGLQHLVADLGTGAVGGINSSTQAWWKNNFYDFSDDNTAAASTTMLHAMNTAYLEVVRGTDRPDIIVSGSTYYHYFEEALQPNQRFTDSEMADAGFENLSYKGIPVVYDSNCAATRMYFLNTDYLFFKASKNHNFTMGTERVPTNQDAVVRPLFWKGNMTCSNRSLQSVIVP